MSEENPNLENEVQQPSELEVLRARADQLGLRYRSNTGVEKLRTMVNTYLENGQVLADEEEQAAVAAAPVQETAAVTATKRETPVEIRTRLRNEARKLVRIRVTCHNPLKEGWEGEIFTFGNSLVGTIKKFVPYEREWHVEQALLNMMRDRQYQHHYTVRGENGRPVNKTKMANEFSIELLDPLTAEELAALAQRQAMANGTAEKVND